MSLATEVVGDPSAPVVWFLHGILGQGRNWRSFARRVSTTLSVQAVLPDLRCHGGSALLEGPHDLRATTADLDALAASHGAPSFVIGHSFGGKVALAWARDTRLPRPAIVVLDSPPGAGGAPAHGTAAEGHPLAILEVLNAAVTPAVDREPLRRALREAQVPEPIVAWLLSSAVRGPEGWVWGWNLEGVHDLLQAYFREDLWPWLSNVQGAPVHVVRGGRSDRWSALELARLSEPGPAVRTHVVPNAGHWLHVDDPEGTFRCLEPLVREALSDGRA